MSKPIIKSKAARLISALAVGAVCAAGLALNLWRGGRFEPKMLTYYTVISNVVVLASCTVQAVSRARELRGRAPRPHPWFSGFALLTISLTFGVMTSVLIPVAMGIDTGMDFTQVRSLLAHYAVPVLAIADWALCCPHGGVKPWYPLTWLAAPIGFFALSLLFAGCGITYDSIGGNVSRFAYFFIDPDAIGWPRTLLHGAAIVIACAATGYTYWFFDNPRRLSKKRAAIAARDSR